MDFYSLAHLEAYLRGPTPRQSIERFGRDFYKAAPDAKFMLIIQTPKKNYIFGTESTRKAVKALFRRAIAR